MTKFAKLASAVFLLASTQLSAQNATLDSIQAKIDEIESQLWADPDPSANSGTGTHSLKDLDADNDAMLAKLNIIESQLWAQPNAEANNGTGTHSLLDLDGDLDKISSSQIPELLWNIRVLQGLVGCVLAVSVLHFAGFIGKTCWECKHRHSAEVQKS